MLERFSEPLAAGVLAASLAGCEQPGTSNDSRVLSPQACLEAWEANGLPTSTEGIRISPAPASELPPELEAAANDASRLVGFASSYEVTENGTAVDPDETQNMIDSGELAGLVFEGNPPVPDNYNAVWAGLLVAPNSGAYLLPGELDGYYDLSGGVAENPKSPWNWGDTFGSEPVLFSTMFLAVSDGDCLEAYTALDYSAASTYEVSPQGVTQVN